jgi:hypothetical protein
MLHVVRRIVITSRAVAGKPELSVEDFHDCVKQLALKKELTLRERIFYTFEEPNCSRSANLVSLLVVASIIASSAGMILETLPTSRVAVHECEGARVSPSPGADVAGVSPVPVRMWQG